MRQATSIVDYVTLVDWDGIVKSEGNPVVYRNEGGTVDLYKTVTTKPPFDVLADIFASLGIDAFDVIGNDRHARTLTEFDQVTLDIGAQRLDEAQRDYAGHDSLREFVGDGFDRKGFRAQERIKPVDEPILGFVAIVARSLEGIGQDLAHALEAFAEILIDLFQGR
jgi:hypothetical protein